MKKNNFGILLFAFMLLSLVSCKNKTNTSKILINEVMVENTNNLVDDFGEHDGWIEIFNKSFGSVDVAGYKIKKISNTGEATYLIPKGNLDTKIKPRQFVVLYADANANNGTFHTNFKLDPSVENKLQLIDGGGKIIDEVIIPASLVRDQSYARKTDGHSGFEVRGRGCQKAVTPGMNNQTLDENPKIENFKEKDSDGVGMAITAMTVVFSGLLILFFLFKFVGKVAVNRSRKNAIAAQGAIDDKSCDTENVPGAVYAAIGMALHEMQEDVHDVENTILTIEKVKRSYSPWSSKIYTLRQNPERKF